MNIHQTLTRVFPFGVVGGCSPDGGGSFEVHGLPRGTAPANCEVLAGGRVSPVHGHGHRDSYLVRTENYILFFDVCAAVPGCGVDAFVECGTYADVADTRSHDLLAYARKSIESQRH